MNLHAAISVIHGWLKGVVDTQHETNRLLRQESLRQAVDLQQGEELWHKLLQIEQKIDFLTERLIGGPVVSIELQFHIGGIAVPDPLVLPIDQEVIVTPIFKDKNGDVTQPRDPNTLKFSVSDPAVLADAPSGGLDVIVPAAGAKSGTSATVSCSVDGVSSAAYELDLGPGAVASVELQFAVQPIPAAPAPAPAPAG